MCSAWGPGGGTFSHRSPPPPGGGGVFLLTEQSWGLQGNKSADSLRNASPPLPGSPDGREWGNSFRGVQGELALEAAKLALGVLPEKSSIKMPRMRKRASWVSSPLSWEGRGVGASREGSLEPRTRPRSHLGSRKPSCGFSAAEAPPALRIPKSSPSSVPSTQMGQGLPGYRACPRHRDPPLGRRWPDLRPSPERLGNWPLPPPRRTYSPSAPPR